MKDARWIDGAEGVTEGHLDNMLQNLERPNISWIEFRILAKSHHSNGWRQFEKDVVSH